MYAAMHMMHMFSSWTRRAHSVVSISEYYANRRVHIKISDITCKFDRMSMRGCMQSHNQQMN